VVNAPISIPLAISPSRKPSDLIHAQALAADALKIERYINAEMKDQYIRDFDLSALSQQLSLDQERVHALLNKLASNGKELTVRNPLNRPKTPPVAQPSAVGNETHPSGNNRRQCWPAQLEESTSR
jgi:hypothetical protein